MRTTSFLLPVLAVLLLVTAACATGSPDAATALRESQRTAISFKASPSEMVVAASPMRRTLQFAGSTGFLVGAGVDLVINSDYKDGVREALQGYDPEAVFRSRLEQRLAEALGRELSAVPAERGAAGYANEADARKARLAGLARQGYDSLLDVRMRYGLYGTGAELVAELDADLRSLPKGKRLWSDTVIVNPRPALASDRLGNPQKKKRSSESDPQFSVDKTAFERWTANGGERLRAGFEQAVEGATAALVAGMGLAPDALGELYLGKMAMNRKDFQEANEHFEAARRLDPGLTEALSAQAVNLAHSGRLEDAITIALGITQATPDFAPAWYNLAWWHAMDVNDPAKARTYYQQALALGMPADPKIEKTLAEAGERD